jgi:hypothetical protein
MFRTRIAVLCLLIVFVQTAELAIAQPLKGTKPLTISQPLDEVMVAGIDRFALRALRQSVEQRGGRWNHDYSSSDAYTKSIAANRARLRTIIGAVDSRPDPHGFELIANTTDSAIVAETEDYTVLAVRWPALDGVYGEGLLLQPKSKPLARVVALPDANWTPEMFVGLVEGVPAGSRSPLRLAASGCQVLIPTLISRADTYSGNPRIRMTNQTHREWIYRQAFQMGRHVIGYEVQKVSAAIDQFARLDQLEAVDLPNMARVTELFQRATARSRLDDAVIIALHVEHELGGRRK